MLQIVVSLTDYNCNMLIAHVNGKHFFFLRQLHSDQIQKHCRSKHCYLKHYQSETIYLDTERGEKGWRI